MQGVADHLGIDLDPSQLEDMMNEAKKDEEKDKDKDKNMDGDEKKWAEQIQFYIIQKITSKKV